MFEKLSKLSMEDSHGEITLQ